MRFGLECLINSKIHYIFVGDTHQTLVLQLNCYTHIAPLGLRGKDISLGYKHVTPLGLNASNPLSHFRHHVSRSVFYPVNPSILNILIQTMIMKIPHLFAFTTPSWVYFSRPNRASHPRRNLEANS